MAKYKVGGDYTGSCDTKLQGDVTPVMDNMLKFSEDRLEFLCTVCTQDQYKAGLKFENTDLLAYINSDVSFSLSRETEETKLPHAKSTFKVTGALTYDDTDITMVMTSENFNKFKEVLKNDESVAIATFDKDRISSKKAPMLESYFGKFSKISNTYKNGSFCEFSVTFSPSEGDVECESPDYE